MTSLPAGDVLDFLQPRPSLFRSANANRGWLQVSEHLRKSQCEKTTPPHTHPRSEPAPRHPPRSYFLAHAMRRRLRSARALPDTVINGARFSPHLILLLSELSGPKTIINSQSSVNPPNTIIPPHPPPTTTSPTPHHLSDEEKRKRDGVRDREVCVCVRVRVKVMETEARRCRVLSPACKRRCDCVLAINYVSQHVC